MHIYSGAPMHFLSGVDTDPLKKLREIKIAAFLSADGPGRRFPRCLVICRVGYDSAA